MTHTQSDAPLIDLRSWKTQLRFVTKKHTFTYFYYVAIVLQIAQIISFFYHPELQIFGSNKVMLYLSMILQFPSVGLGTIHELFPESSFNTVWSILLPATIIAFTFWFVCTSGEFESSGQNSLKLNIKMNILLFVLVLVPTIFFEQMFHVIFCDPRASIYNDCYSTEWLLSVLLNIAALICQLYLHIKIAPWIVRLDPYSNDLFAANFFSWPLEDFGISAFLCLAHNTVQNLYDWSIPTLTLPIFLAQLIQTINPYMYFNSPWHRLLIVKQSIFLITAFLMMLKTMTSSSVETGVVLVYFCISTFCSLCAILIRQKLVRMAVFTTKPKGQLTQNQLRSQSFHLVNILSNWLKGSDGFEYRFEITKHQQSCIVVTCRCKQLRNVVGPLTENDQNTANLLMTDIIQSMYHSCPTDPFLLNCFLYTRLNLLKTSYFAHNFNIKKFGRKNAFVQYSVAQFVYCLELYRKELHQAHCDRSKINWEKQFSFYFELECFFELCWQYVQMFEKLCETLSKNKPPLSLLEASLRGLHEARLEITKRFKHLEGFQVESVLWTYYRLLELAKIDVFEMEDVSKQIKQIRMVTDLKPVRFSFDHTFALTVSMNVKNYGIIIRASKNLKKFLLYEATDIAGQSICALMPNVSAAVHQKLSFDFLTSKTGRELNHEQQMIMIKRSGFLWCCELFVNMNPSIEAGGYQFNCLIKKESFVKAHQSVMVIDLSTMHLVAVTEGMFRVFGVGPSLCYGQSESDDIVKFIKFAFPELREEDWTGEHLNFGSGESTMFDFDCVKRCMKLCQTDKDHPAEKGAQKMIDYWKNLKMVMSKLPERFNVKVAPIRIISYRSGHRLGFFEITVLNEQVRSEIDQLLPFFEENIKIKGKFAQDSKDLKGMMMSSKLYARSCSHNSLPPIQQNTSESYSTRISTALRRRKIAHFVFIGIIVSGIVVNTGMIMQQLIRTETSLNDLSFAVKVSGDALVSVNQIGALLGRVSTWHRLVNWSNDTSDCQAEIDFFSNTYSQQLFDNYTNTISLLHTLPFMQPYLAQRNITYQDHTNTIPQFLELYKSYYYTLTVQEFYKLPNLTLAMSVVRNVSALTNASQPVLQALRDQCLGDFEMMFQMYFTIFENIHYIMTSFSVLLIICSVLVFILVDLKLQRIYAALSSLTQVQFEQAAKKLRVFKRTLIQIIGHPTEEVSSASLDLCKTFQEKGGKPAESDEKESNSGKKQSDSAKKSAILELLRDLLKSVGRHARVMIGATALLGILLIIVSLINDEFGHTINRLTEKVAADTNCQNAVLYFQSQTYITMMLHSDHPESRFWLEPLVPLCESEDTVSLLAYHQQSLGSSIHTLIEETQETDYPLWAEQFIGADVMKRLFHAELETVTLYITRLFSSSLKVEGYWQTSVLMWQEFLGHTVSRVTHMLTIAMTFAFDTSNEALLTNFGMFLKLIITINAVVSILMFLIAICVSACVNVLNLKRIDLMVNSMLEFAMTVEANNDGSVMNFEL